ncbi:peptidoglycan bridge formation glycyltransferase FemA/FemB family protein [Pseudalkalibacillus sp. JSM 102089]|uniref:peptidoglycan bridge formation glycyltransferase FemA/FemB family protein n=1 Tax=Pseudalkalibacillus sp. JSM 102089 TaxID=3229856 RepID=UPI003523B3D8
MGIKILDLNQKKKWHEYLNRLEHRDIYFTPEYCEIHERNGEGKAQLYIYEEKENFVIYPFLLRNLNTLPHLKTVIEDYGELYDITTPYGYGGPITNVKEKKRVKELLSLFSISFKNYCKTSNIITEFVRFHPLYQNQECYPEIEKSYIRDTIYVDLTREYEEIWANYDTKNRNRIRKTRSYNLQIKHRNPQERSDFLKLYYATMERTGAKEYYHFSEAYFDNTFELLKDRIELIEVVCDKEKVVMSVIFMYGNKHIHYHLLGSDHEYLPLAINNYVVDYAIQWAKKQGFESMHLGGGYTGNDDSLYKFKKHFNKTGALPFYVAKQIHNQKIYQELSSTVPRDVQGFFPVYRHADLLHVTSQG